MHERIVYLEHESEVLKENPLGDPFRRTLSVYLPPQYQSMPDSRYPVIWVLAPFTSWGERFFNHAAWDENIIQRMDRLVGEGKAAPTILAFPDCFTRYGGSQYRNSSAVGRYEDYVVKELVPYLDANLRTLPVVKHRGVMGYSSGGYGALALAFSHGDVFGAVDLKTLTHIRDKGSDWYNALNTVAMSAAYSPNPADPNGFDLPFDPYTGAIVEEVWACWEALDPVNMVADSIDVLKNMRAVYFDCGINDEYNLFLGARLLHQILSEHEIDHVYEEHEGGHRHINWRYESSLPILTHALSRQDG
jgi:enterochelin esterase-like enzyme